MLPLLAVCRSTAFSSIRSVQAELHICIYIYVCVCVYVLGLLYLDCRQTSDDDAFFHLSAPKTKATTFSSLLGSPHKKWAGTTGANNRLCVSECWPNASLALSSIVPQAKKLSLSRVVPVQPSALLRPRHSPLS